MHDTRADLTHHICQWHPSQLARIAAQLSADHPTPAKSFAAYDAYIAYFEPLVLAEVAADLAATLAKAQAAAAAAAAAAASASASAPSAAAGDPPRRVPVGRTQRVATGWHVDVGPPRPSTGMTTGTTSTGTSTGGGSGSSTAPMTLFDGDVVVLWPTTAAPEPTNAAGAGGRNAITPAANTRNTPKYSIPESATLAVALRSLSRRGGTRLFMKRRPGKDDLPADLALDEAAAAAAAAAAVVELEEGEYEEEADPSSNDWMLLKLGSIVTARREYDAVRNIKNSPLMPSVLSTGQRSSSSTAPTRQHSALAALAMANRHTLSPEMQQTLAYADGISAIRGLNPSQVSAIAVASTSTQGFTIIQGPPGTGKTRTILSLLNVLHVDHYQRYYNGLLTSLEYRTGALYSDGASEQHARAKQQEPRLDGLLGTMASALNRTLSSVLDRKVDSAGTRKDILHAGERRGMFGLPRRPRLLVCAPSNAAVDEILSRMTVSKFVDGKGAQYCPEIARIGAGDKVSEAARPFTAEGQAEAFLNRISGPGWSAAAIRTAQFAFLANWQNMCNSLLVQLEHTPKDQASRPRVVALHEQLERLCRDLRRLRIASAGNLEVAGSRDTRLRKLARTYVEDAQVVFATLSGSASAILTQKNDTVEHGALFDTVVLDEGAQATEPSSLIPLALGAVRCILVGDPQQLPATVLASGSAGVAYGQSLLDRLCRSGSELVLLDTQYRMHPAISSFPRRYFYGGRLIDHESVQDEHRSKPYHEDALKPRLGPYAFMDVAHGYEQHGSDDRSIFNPQEAELAAIIYKKLKKCYASDSIFSSEGKLAGSPAGFGVVTPYRRQLQALRQAFDRAGVPTGDVEIDTVDAYQGREKDFVIFSCVRTADRRRGIGFVRDVRRMNVGLTRARSSLIVLGSASALSQGSVDWAELIDDAQSRGCLIHVTSIHRALTLNDSMGLDRAISGSSSPVHSHSIRSTADVNAVVGQDPKSDATGIQDTSHTFPGDPQHPMLPEKEKNAVPFTQIIEIKDDMVPSSTDSCDVDSTQSQSVRGTDVGDKKLIGSPRSLDTERKPQKELAYEPASKEDGDGSADLDQELMLTELPGDSGINARGVSSGAAHVELKNGSNLEESTAVDHLNTGTNSTPENNLENVRTALSHLSGLLDTKGSFDFRKVEGILVQHVSSGGKVDLETVVAAALAAGAESKSEKPGGASGDPSSSQALAHNEPVQSRDEECQPNADDGEIVAAVKVELTQNPSHRVQPGKIQADLPSPTSTRKREISSVRGMEDMDLDKDKKRSKTQKVEDTLEQATAPASRETKSHSGWEMLFGGKSSSAEVGVAPQKDVNELPTDIKPQTDAARGGAPKRRGRGKFEMHGEVRHNDSSVSRGMRSNQPVPGKNRGRLGNELAGGLLRPNFPGASEGAPGLDQYAHQAPPNSYEGPSASYGIPAAEIVSNFSQYPAHHRFDELRPDGGLHGGGGAFGDGSISMIGAHSSWPRQHGGLMPHNAGDNGPYYHGGGGGGGGQDIHGIHTPAYNEMTMYGQNSGICGGDYGSLVGPAGDGNMYQQQQAPTIFHGGSSAYNMNGPPMQSLGDNPSHWQPSDGYSSRGIPAAPGPLLHMQAGHNGDVQNGGGFISNDGRDLQGFNMHAQAGLGMQAQGAGIFPQYPPLQGGGFTGAGGPMQMLEARPGDNVNYGYGETAGPAYHHGMPGSGVHSGNIHGGGMMGGVGSSWAPEAHGHMHPVGDVGPTMSGESSMGNGMYHVGGDRGRAFRGRRGPRHRGRGRGAIRGGGGPGSMRSR